MQDHGLRRFEKMFFEFNFGDLLIETVGINYALSVCAF